MSRKGDRWESLPLGYNAPMESFWGTLKNELVHHRNKYLTRQQAKKEITEYIELFYLCPVGITGNANKHDLDFYLLSLLPRNIS